MPRIAWHLLLILLPVVAVFAILPGLYSNHLMLFNFIIFMTLAQGINVIYGFTGYLPFGYVGFFGAGAYGFSLMVIHLHAPPLIALPVGAAAAIVLALLLTPLFRLSGAYFSIANLAAALAVLQVVSNPNLEEITKGPYGISLSGVFDPALSYATALAVLAATLALVIYLRNSHFGMALKAIREDPISAGMAGINVVRERVIAWLLSALIAGLAGGVFAWYVSVFYPETVFSVEFTIFAIVFALFGGNATVIGPILGVVILYGIYNAVGISTPQYFQLALRLVDHGPGDVPAQRAGVVVAAMGHRCPLTPAAPRRRRSGEALRRVPRARRSQLQGRCRRNSRPCRTERLRQDHVHQRHLRALPAGRRHGSFRRTLDRRLAVAPARARGHQPYLPGAEAVPHADRARERRDREDLRRQPRRGQVSRRSCPRSILPASPVTPRASSTPRSRRCSISRGRSRPVRGSC